MKNYIFCSERLGFRTFDEADTSEMVSMNNNQNVMRFFPFCPNEQQTKDFMKRMNKEFEKKKYCYFAVDRLDTKEFIGFIGLLDQDYDAPFTPCTDIGWRLKEEHWYKGFATEGALACLNYAFTKLNKEIIYSTAPQINLPSLSVMKKIGMKKEGSYEHSRLLNYPKIRTCDYYSIKKANG